ncbi:SubName: Full=Related to Rho3 GTP binding protein {ECO:0000313/EMBL:CCA75601.1} [Serendipita indica DSM 11827]|nr:SubName: Full=Related to Rho3 GTP binding protein {ECO:0000313/EMBL:CCA75601.1} [Serendipita indica DSM 11827]
MVAHKIAIVGDTGVGKTFLGLRVLGSPLPIARLLLNSDLTLTVLGILAFSVLCLSVDDPTSFENVESLWWPEIAHWIPEVPIILVGTKKDVSRKVSIDEVLNIEQ